jgi:hypothetical protein
LPGILIPRFRRQLIKYGVKGHAESGHWLLPVLFGELAPRPRITPG